MKATEKELREFGHLICRIATGDTMSREESREAYRQVILNIQPELQQGAFLMAHIARKPTIDELAGAWDAMDLYDTAKISVEDGQTVCDIVGTGSDNLKTVNCSTPAALIASACGLTVAKKGARLVTGVSGASDTFEILGINLSAPLDAAEKSLKDNGICYLPGEAFLKSGWARLIKTMRFTSAFNIIGPLTRPCEQTNRIVIGAYAPEVCDQLTWILKDIGMEASFAPYGMVDGMEESLGMDEFSPCGSTRVSVLKNSKIEVIETRPEDFGIKPIPFEKISSGKNAVENAGRITDALKFKHDSPDADFFCANAAAALHLSDFAANFAEGFTMAKQALASGKAYEKLELLRECQGI